MNFVELLKEDSLLEIEIDIFTFSALSNRDMIEIENKFSNKSEIDKCGQKQCVGGP